jgi:hypothetical protein
VRPFRVVRSRLLLVLGVLLFATGIARAQAPPPSFFEGRSSEDLRALASDPRNDVLLRRSAATRLVITLADEGDFDAAEAAAREFARNIDPAAPRHVQTARRRRYVHLGAIGVLGVALGLAALSLVAGRRLLARALGAVRRIVPLVAVFFLYMGLAGGYLASSYENGSAMPFVLFAAFMLPLAVLFRMWSAVGSSRLPARVGRGVAAVAATFALGFLVVELVNPTYLEGFGL